MESFIISEIVITDLFPDQKTELRSLLGNSDPFGSLMPVPPEKRKDPKREKEWKRKNWGTEGISNGCFFMESNSGFGEKSDSTTLIFTCGTIVHPPYGILKEISCRYPRSLCLLRTPAVGKDEKKWEETAYWNGRKESGTYCLPDNQKQ